MPCSILFHGFALEHLNTLGVCGARIVKYKYLICNNYLKIKIQF